MGKGAEAIENGRQASRELDQTIQDSLQSTLKKLIAAGLDPQIDIERIHKDQAIAKGNIVAEAVEIALEHETDVVAQKIKDLIKEAGLPGKLKMSVIEAREKGIQLSDELLLGYAAYLILNQKDSE